LVITKAHQIYHEREAEKKQNDLLAKSNNQLEFMLRQKLIS
jgi:hypothetical protein